MDGNTNDQDPNVPREIPPDVSPDELKEALEWLDELTGRSTTGSTLGDEEMAAADTAPFQGMLDESATDLPDWLREAAQPPVETPLTEEDSFESRMDWLAQMAERESIEELPTLEWRRLSDPTLVPADENAPRTVELERDTEPLPVDYTPGGYTAEEETGGSLTAEAVLHVSPDAQDIDDEGRMEAALKDTAESELEWLATEAAEPGLATDESPANAITPETLLDSLPPDVELPPIDDLDAAMAWIEELAASQDAPIEDVPSVADRALASKLLMEAGLPPDSLDLRQPGNQLALGDLSLLEGNTPVNEFVAAEDFADTIVLVETMAADQGRSLEPPDMPPVGQLPGSSQAETATFDDAMAFLDELAAAQEPLGSITQPLPPVEVDLPASVEIGPSDAEEPDMVTEPPGAVTQYLDLTVGEAAEPPAVEPEAIVAAAVTVAPTAAGEPEEGAGEALNQLEEAVAERATDVHEGESEVAETTPVLAPEPELALEEDWPEQALSADEAPWLEEAAVVAVVLPPREEADGDTEFAARANGDNVTSLEDALRSVDGLALPAGRSLADVDASLRQSGATPTRRDLPAAVEWLELALGISVATPAYPPPTDDELIARMPDDPDAVLAWLEQMAEEDTLDSSPTLSTDAGMLPANVAVPAPAARSPDSRIEELSEDDLLGMPDDPDAVIAWLEGLAGGPQTEMTPPVEEAQSPAALVEQSQMEAVTVMPRPRRRRGRRPRGHAPTEAAIPPELEPEAGPEPAVASELQASAALVPETEVDQIEPEASTTVEGYPEAMEPADEAVEGVKAQLLDSTDEPAGAVSDPAIADSGTGRLLRVAARPRRVRRLKAAVHPAQPMEPATSEAASGAIAEGASAITVGAVPTTEQASTPPEPPGNEPPDAPAPTSWVDLLKPLR